MMFADNDVMLGMLAATAVTVALFLYMRKAVKAETGALDFEAYRKFPLIEKKVINHNTRLFRFGLASPSSVLGLPIGKHVMVQAEVGGQLISRAYTPTSSNDDAGHFDLVVKVYASNDKKPAGKMSTYLDGMKIGQSVNVKGPMGKFIYNGLGQYDMGARGGGVATHIGMLAGGTGITPMLQIIRAIMKDKNDHTEMSMIFGNVEEQDILLREELDADCKACPRLRVYHTLNKASDSWKQGRGFVSSDMIKAHLPGPSKSTIILICGPKPFVDAMVALLVALNYSSAMLYKF